MTASGRVVGPGFHERVYAAVREVPAGRVTTYGDVAGHLGTRRVARHVGNALAALPRERTDVPWHRVVNSSGALSRRGDGRLPGEQRTLLEAEGVDVDASGRIVAFASLRHAFLTPRSTPSPPRRPRAPGGDGSFPARARAARHRS